MNFRFVYSAAAFCIFPAVFLLPWLLDNPGATPAADYWAIFGSLIEEDKLSLSQLSWFSRNNEHVVVISKLFYLVNFFLFDGHSLGLSLLALSLAAASGLVLLLLLPPQISASWSMLALSTFAISIYLFTPRAAELWFFGSNGIDWFLSNLLFLMGLVGVRRAATKGSLTWYAVGASCSLAAMVTFGIGLLASPLVLLYGVWQRLPWRWSGTFLALIVLLYGAVAWGYERPAHHPILTEDLRLLASFVGTMLGRIVPRGNGGLPLQTGVGFAAIGVFALIAYAASELPRQQRNLLAPWVIIVGYALGNAVLIAIARAGFGLDQALAGRYSGITSLFLISLFVMLLFFAVSEVGRLRRFIWILLLVVFGAPTSVGAISTFEAEAFLTNSHLRRMVDLGVSMGIEDKRLAKYTGDATSAAIFLSKKSALRNIGHVPYGFQPACMEYFKNTIAPIRSPRRQIGLDSKIKLNTNSKPNYAELSGWMKTEDKTLSCIAVLDAKRQVVGIGLPGYPRDDDKWRPGVKMSRSGWMALSTTAHANRLEVAAKFENQVEWQWIRGCFIRQHGRMSFVHVESCR